jgi:alpha-tubulin suppressor-like RCC1 family protein
LVRDRYRDIQKKKSKKNKNLPVVEETPVDDENEDDDDFDLSDDDDDFKLIDFAAERSTKKPTKEKNNYPPTEKPAFTMKKIIRVLHINQPSYHVQCLLGQRYPATAEEFEARGLSTDIPTRKKRTTPYQFDQSMTNHRMRLPIPETWETQLSKNGNRHETWQLLIDNNNLPFMAMLRNLRNLLLTGVEAKYHEWAQAKLRDKDTIAHSRQFPFRFFSAYQAINVDINKLKEYKKMNASQLNELRNTNVRIIVPHQVPTQEIIENYRQALDTAVQLSVTNNIPRILGRTSILCNVSETMQSSVSGSAVGDFTSPVEIALLLALMCYYVVEHPESDFSIFSSPGVLNMDSTYINLRTFRGTQDDILRGLSTDFLKKGFILDNMRRILTLVKQMGGQSHMPTDYLESIIDSTTFVDQIVMFGAHVDESHHLKFKYMLTEYRRKVNPNVLFVCVDLFGSGSSVVNTNEGDAHPNDVLVTGFSDSILKFIAERSNQAQIRYVQQIDKIKNIVAPQRLVADRNKHRGKKNKKRVPIVNEITRNNQLLHFQYTKDDQYTQRVVQEGSFQTVLCRYKYTLALTSQFQVLACGDFGGLCNGTVSSDSFKIIVKPEDVDGRIVSIASGANHMLMLTDKGQVYAIGENDRGQLGSEVENFTNKPVKVTPKDGEYWSVIAIVCGANYSAFLTEKGDVFTCGSNEHHNLGTNGSSQLPQRVLDTQLWDFKERSVKKENWMDTVKQIACGGSHTCVVNDRHELWNWGNNEHGQLGRDGPSHTPGLVQFFTKKEIDIALVRCGEYHTIAMTTYSRLFAFGLGMMGQLGTGSRCSERIPLLISAFPPHFVLDVQCSKSYCIATTKNGGIFQWGSSSTEGTENCLPTLVRSATGNTTSVSVGDEHFAILCGKYGFTIHFNITDTRTCLSVDLLGAINDPTFSNVTMTIKSAEQTLSLLVHDYILQNRSPEFVSIFCLDMSSPKGMTIDLTNISAKTLAISIDTLLLLIEYIYTDHIGYYNPKSDIDYKQLKQWAERMNMKRLQSLCDHSATPVTSTLHEDMKKLYTTTRSTNQGNDWILCAQLPSNNIQNIPVHAGILASRSEYMRSLLLFAKAEQAMNQQSTNVVTLSEEVSAEAIECIVNYLYSGNVEADCNNITDVLQLSNQYCLPELQMRCEYDIRLFISLENVCGLLEFSDFHELMILRAFCIKYILDNVEEVYKSKEYQDLSKRCPLLADEIKKGKKLETKRKQEHYQARK